MRYRSAKGHLISRVPEYDSTSSLPSYAPWDVQTAKNEGQGAVAKEIASSIRNHLRVKWSYPALAPQNIILVGLKFDSFKLRSLLSNRVNALLKPMN